MSMTTFPFLKRDSPTFILKLSLKNAHESITIQQDAPNCKPHCPDYPGHMLTTKLFKSADLLQNLHSLFRPIFLHCPRCAPSPKKIECPFWVLHPRLKISGARLNSTRRPPYFVHSRLTRLTSRHIDITYKRISLLVRTVFKFTTHW